MAEGDNVGTGYRPIRVADFRLPSGSELERICLALQGENLPVEHNFYKDPLCYYRHLYPEFWVDDTDPVVFVATCKMNECLAQKPDLEIVRIETILEGEITIDEGVGYRGTEVVGVRVFYRVPCEVPGD